MLEAYELLAKADDDDRLAETTADVDDSSAEEELPEFNEANVD